MWFALPGRLVFFISLHLYEFFKSIQSTGDYFFHSNAFVFSVPQSDSPCGVKSLVCLAQRILHGFYRHACMSWHIVGTGEPLSDSWSSKYHRERSHIIMYCALILLVIKPSFSSFPETDNEIYWFISLVNKPSLPQGTTVTWMKSSFTLDKMFLE